MLYAGAANRTADQMAAALHFTLPAERLHAAFDDLDLKLTAPAGDDPGAFRLKIANSTWVQDGFAAEVAAVLAEKAILDLRGPVLRVTGYDVPYPFWQLEDVYMPSEARLLEAARTLLDFA